MQKAKEFMGYYGGEKRKSITYDLDTVYHYDDIECILNVLPKDFSYSNFSLSCDDDHQMGSFRCFTTINELYDYCYNHLGATMDEMAFILHDSGNEIFVNLFFGTDLLGVFGNTIKLNPDEFASSIEKALLENKKQVTL